GRLGRGRAAVPGGRAVAAPGAGLVGGDRASRPAGRSGAGHRGRVGAAAARAGGRAVSPAGGGVMSRAGGGAVSVDTDVPSATDPTWRVPERVEVDGEVVTVTRAWPGKERQGSPTVIIEGRDRAGRLRAGTVRRD